MGKAPGICGSFENEAKILEDLVNWFMHVKIPGDNYVSKDEEEKKVKKIIYRQLAQYDLKNMPEYAGHTKASVESKIEELAKGGVEPWMIWYDLIKTRETKFSNETYNLFIKSTFDGFKAYFKSKHYLPADITK